MQHLSTIFLVWPSTRVKFVLVHGKSHTPPLISDHAINKQDIWFILVWGRPPPKKKSPGGGRHVPCPAPLLFFLTLSLLSIYLSLSFFFFQHDTFDTKFV